LELLFLTKETIKNHSETITFDSFSKTGMHKGDQHENTLQGILRITSLATVSKDSRHGNLAILTRSRILG